MNNGLEIKRCSFLPEGEMAIVKDYNMLIHNIVDSELQEKDKEIERLNKLLDETRQSELNKEYIINELEKWLEELNKPENDMYGYHKQLGIKIDIILDKLKELKEKK